MITDLKRAKCQLDRKVMFVLFSNEEQAEYSITFERNLRQSRRVIFCMYCVVFIAFIFYTIPLLLDPDIHNITTSGIYTRFLALLLCFILVAELVMNAAVLSKSLLFPSQLSLINKIVILNVVGACLQYAGRIVNGACEDGQEPDTCNPLHEAGYYPSVMLLDASFLLFAQIVGQLNHGPSISFCWFSITSTMAYTFVVYDFRDCLIGVFYLLLMTTSSLKYWEHGKRQFLSVRQCAKADREALELIHTAQVMEGRVSDMRHLIGNGKQ
jgi:hypothetical protein